MIDAIENLNVMAANVLKNRPTRVLVNGECVREGWADFALIREDGYSLGYTVEDEAAAWAEWANEWVGRLNMTTGELELVNYT